MEYEKFLSRKRVETPLRGMDIVPELSGHLFPFQSHCVDFALRAGNCGLFLDTGLGKTECQLEFAQKALEHVNGKALILTPLAVAGQTKRRAERWGYDATIIREMSDVRPGINIVNYDRLDRIDPDEFAVVCLDEGSILKSFTGKTTRALISAFQKHKFKMVATATPAPNDHMEIGQYCEFLDVMRSSEMLMRWFISNQKTMGKYVLKGWAEKPFWEWMAGWARMAEKPSDLMVGFSDDGYDLPPFEIFRHKSRPVEIGATFEEVINGVNMSATAMHDVKRQTSEARAEKVAELVCTEPDEPWIIWCDTDYEADHLKKAVTDVHEVRGSMPVEKKEEIIEAFSTGKIKRLIGKPSMLGFGLDWSHVARMAFAGRSYSYETWYQAVRRCWRFGQNRTLHVHLVVAEGESEIGRIIDRKASDHAKMRKAMRDAMRRMAGGAASVKIQYNPKFSAEVPKWLKSYV